MKILMITHEYYPKGSGIANVVYNLNKSMTRQGHKVHVCSPIGPDIKIDNTYNKIEKFGGFGIAIFWYKVGKILKELSKEYDKIYFHNPLLFHKALSDNITCVVHTLFYFTFKDSDFKNIKKIPYYLGMIELEWFSYTRLRRSKFIVTSPKTIRELKHYGVNQKIPIIYNGYDFNIKKVKLPKKCSYLKAEKTRLLYVGRLAHKKNIPKLLMTFKELYSFNNNFELTIVPGQTESADHIKKFIKHHQIKGVKILGGITHQELMELYKHFHYFISASMYEGFPLTLSEACASGLIPILSPIEIFKHVIETLNIGLIVDFSKKDAAANIKEFCKLPRPTEKLKKLSKKYFNWDSIAKEYLKN